MGEHSHEQRQSERSLRGVEPTARAAEPDHHPADVHDR